MHNCKHNECITVSGIILGIDAIASSEESGITALVCNFAVLLAENAVEMYSFAVLPIASSIMRFIVPNCFIDTDLSDMHNTVPVTLHLYRKFNAYYCYDTEFYDKTKNSAFYHEQGVQHAT